MPYTNLLLTDSNGIRTITINRPDKLNALNAQTIAELDQAFRAAQTDDAVRVLVLTGSGDKAFVAGADIAELDGQTPVIAAEFSRRGQVMMRLIETLGKPVIARVQGYALGGGMEIAMACTVRIASKKARFGLPEITLGILPGFGGTQRLQRLCGRGNTLHLALTGKPISAERAFELGIVQELVEHEALDTAVDALATQLASSAPHAMRGLLHAVIQGGDAPIDIGLSYETNAFGLCASTADKAEGTRAFLEKRKAEFQGN
jgi:enoyl-CoA hydratase